MEPEHSFRKWYQEFAWQIVQPRDWRRDTNLTTPRDLTPERSQPQFQHSENCPSIFSPQPAQLQDFFPDASGARFFLRIDFARLALSSSITQSSGQHSIGGNSPAALIKSSFLVTHFIPNVASTLFRW